MPAPAAETEPKIRVHGPVRVSLPAKIAYNPDALKKSIGGLMEQLGCPRCFSGADCLFTFERDYVVNPQGGISAVELNPQPLPPRLNAATGHATASLGRSMRFDIDKVFKAVDQVINTLGPCPCHSGFDVLYQNELPVIGINDQGAQKFGG
jgi:hypothetical protein